MKRRNILILSAIAALELALLPGNAVAQQKPLKDQLVGTWTPVSIQNVRPDGSKGDSFSPTPKGILMFDSNGHFSLQILRPDMPKYASNNRLQGTPEENKATVQGVIASYGTYTVNEADKSYTMHMVGSSWPNYDGTDQKRTVTFNGDEMNLSFSGGSLGGNGNQVWKRMK
jgi:hypothetical protein